MRSISELTEHVSALETALAEVETSLTRLRFALERITNTDTPAHANLLKMQYDCEQSLLVLHTLHKLALWDLETFRDRTVVVG